ncbi:TPA: hypothetical protein WIV18_001956 [Neisseria meningitidis]|uniref:hypothetical protein n=1 Tax=Neisseria meningitidis TaxID=487 RepID=UPI000ABF19EB|nr:hypothetical protein [Neisseria meningitidis]MCL5897097.1 hypothetical protein [Neisseria meningitidis]MCL5937633.1 hypothetical protein [Neisseria meningitidis]
MQQDFIGKNRTPTAVIPAQAGIQRRNATGIYRKKQNPPHRRHSRESGNPATEKPQESISKNRNPTAVIPAKAGIQQPKNHRNLSAKTETPPPSFPQKRESRPVGTETYRIKQFP